MTPAELLTFGIRYAQQHLPISEDGFIAVPFHLLQVRRWGRLLLRNTQHELAGSGDDFSAVGEQDFETDLGGVAGEGVDLVGLTDTIKGITPDRYTTLR